MSKYVFTNTGFKRAARQYVFNGGDWRNIMVAYVYSGGAWKALDKYRWVSGDWGACSQTCGGGTQSRSVTCQDSQNKVMPDNFCARLVGAKPATTQDCNTQSCTLVQYARTTTPYYYVHNCASTGWRWYWNGSIISTSSAASIVVGGYTYTRGTSRESVAKDCRVGSGYNNCTGVTNVTYYTGTYYEISQTPN